MIISLDKESEMGGFQKEYHQLPLQVDKIQFFPLTWTVVHIVDKDSPISGLNVHELQARNAEIIALAEAFDETHSQTVFERQSYAGDQWLENVKFARNFRTNENGEIELFINELDDVTLL